MSLPTVTVVMPIRDERDFIERSLRAVLAQDYPADRFGVIVADGQSTDGTLQIVRSLQKEHPCLELIENPGRIVASGLNLAVSRARGDVVVRVDGHCEIAPDYVRRCVEHLVRDGVDGVGGPLETVGEGRVAGVVAIAMSSPFGVGGSAFRTRPGQTGLVDTVAFPAYWRSTLQKAGPFDEELVRNQDDEYNYRLRKAGAKLLLAADVRCRYYSRSSFRSLWRQYFQYGAWKVRVLQKHPRQMKLRQFVPPLFMAAILTGLAAAAVSPLGRLWAAAVAGSYALAVVLASVRTASRSGWKTLPLLPRAFAILHVAYGSGFLVGLVRFRKTWGTFYKELLLPWHFTVRVTQLLLDASVLVSAFAAAYLLRFDFRVPPRDLANAWRQLPVVVLIQLTVLSLAGVHRFIWRYVGNAGSADDAARRSSVPPCRPGAARRTARARPARWRVPLSVIVIDAMLAFIGVLGLRLARRVVFEYREKTLPFAARRRGRRRSRTLLVGAGRAGVLAAREILGTDEMGLEVVGFVDDDPIQVGAEIHGLPRPRHDTTTLPGSFEEPRSTRSSSRLRESRGRRSCESSRSAARSRFSCASFRAFTRSSRARCRLRACASWRSRTLLAREPVQLDEKQIARFLEGQGRS